MTDPGSSTQPSPRWRRTCPSTARRAAPAARCCCGGSTSCSTRDGVEHVTTRPVSAVCRCGHSAVQPWCDGTHKVVRPGWEAAEPSYAPVGGEHRMTVRTAQYGPLSIAYDHRVLEPRPWTAAQSRWVSALLESAPAGPVLEICSGAGHIGLLAVHEHPRPLVMVDVDPVACSFAERNAAAAGMADRVTVRCGDMHEVLDPTERYAAIVADPPWVTTAEVGRLPGGSAAGHRRWREPGSTWSAPASRSSGATSLRTASPCCRWVRAARPTRCRPPGHPPRPRTGGGGGRAARPRDARPPPSLHGPAAPESHLRPRLRWRLLRPSSCRHRPLPGHDYLITRPRGGPMTNGQPPERAPSRSPATAPTG